MAVKLKKYPKKPKASASTESMEKYLKRVKDIDRENNTRLRLSKEIAKIGGTKGKKTASTPAKKSKKRSRKRK